MLGSKERLISDLRKNAVEIKNSRWLDIIAENVGDSRIVLLGEATHGTSEFYQIRAEISKKLIEEQQFSFIAVEGDWPACYEVNRYIKNYKNAKDTAEHALEYFTRWPTWMWANEEVLGFVQWLRRFNSNKIPSKKIGFYGLDVYSLWESLHAILDYLEKIDHSLLSQAIKAYRCFEPYNEDEHSYAQAASFAPKSCQKEVIALLSHIQREATNFPKDMESAFNVEQNALVALNAEKYYRAMLQGDPSSWNVRDRHMMQTLSNLLKRKRNMKAIVWAHNTHIGDARATDMKDDGMINIGQLAREQYPGQVFSIGFSTYHGDVIAARHWGERMEIMDVPAAAKNSAESLMHSAGLGNFFFLTKSISEKSFYELVGHRAIGVVYNPSFEIGNYVPSILPQRYDMIMHVDRTSSLSPIYLAADEEKVPETYPAGV